MYASSKKKSNNGTESNYGKKGGYEVNYTPVNFFASEYSDFQSFTEIKDIKSTYLNPGDCIYVPSFYYYSYFGMREVMDSVLLIRI